MRWSVCPRLNEDDFDAKAESTLLDRCRKALAVLERHGIRDLILLVRIEDRHAADSYIASPRFCDGIRVLKKDVDELREAVGDLRMTVEKAIEADVEDDVDNEFPSSFYAYVAIGREDEADATFGWSIYCSVTATVEDDRPDLAIKLR